MQQHRRDFLPQPEKSIGGINMKRQVKGTRNRLLLVLTILLLGFSMAAGAGKVSAKSAKEIDIGVDVTLEQFEKEVSGGKEFLRSAKGVLVFPSVIKAGFGIGGEYGEGALRIGGKTVDYYSTAAASIGFQLGAQSKRVILVFMQADALKQFRESSGWEAGVDGSVALVELGAGGSIDTSNIKDPIVGFVFGNKGLMYNLTLEGSKFTKLKK
jgi:lipid-binding SYLF domain-containing protein